VTHRVVEPAIGPPGGRETCARCGFTVNFTGASPKGTARLRDVLNDHLALCPTLPTARQRRDLKRAVTSARFLYGEARAVEVAEDHLARIGGANAA